MFRYLLTEGGAARYMIVSTMRPIFRLDDDDVFSSTDHRGRNVARRSVDNRTEMFRKSFWRKRGARAGRALAAAASVRRGGTDWSTWRADWSEVTVVST